jgi:hypothetical protein
LNQFYQVFRANTNKPRKAKDPLEEAKKQREAKEADGEKLMNIRKFIEKIRKDKTERAKSMQHLPKTLYTRTNLKASLKAKKRFGCSKSKSRSARSLEKSRDSYQDYAKVAAEPKLVIPKNSNEIKKMFLALKTKSIPIDLLPAYVKHLDSKRPVKSRIFSEFDTKMLIKKLSDPSAHSVIFDIVTEQHVTVGTIVLSESLGGRRGKLKYMMEFMSVQPFELVSVSILRVA